MKTSTGTVGLNPQTITDSVATYLTDHPVTEVEPQLAAHIVSTSPHPAYDDDMNLDVYLENGMT